jgi:superfamily I DNA/RNA helicase
VEIAEFAATGVRNTPAVAEDLAGYGEEWVEAELSHPWARHGSPPTLRGFQTPAAERAYVVAEIRALLSRGRSASDILVLQARRETAAPTAQALRREGVPAAIVKKSGLTFEPPAVNVCTYHSGKGLEFPVVFCSMTHLFPDSRRRGDPEDAKQKEAEAARLLYVGMTRARDLLYVTYQTR